MSMPEQEREPFDTNLFMRVPGSWKADLDAAARRMNLKYADLYRMVVDAGMVHLGIRQPEDPDHDPGAPPETVARVLHLRRRPD